MKYSIRIDGVEHDHAESRADAKRKRDTMVYGGLIAHPSEATIVLEHGAPDAETFTVKGFNIQPGMTVDFGGSLGSDAVGYGEYVGEATVIDRLISSYFGFMQALVKTSEGRYLTVDFTAAADYRIVS